MLMQICFNATPEEARKSLTKVRAKLRALAVPLATIGTVELVLAEVTNNIVEHAYNNSGSGKVTLRCNSGKGTLWFETLDHGKPFEQNSLPQKQCHNLQVPRQNLPEGGFGWGLIRDLTLSLSYQRSEDINILRFSLPLTRS